MDKQLKELEAAEATARDTWQKTNAARDKAYAAWSKAYAELCDYKAKPIGG